MYRKTLMLYVLLIGLPAVVFTLCAVWLLGGVRQQLVSADHRHWQDIAERKAHDITRFVTDIQNDLLRQVSTLPQETLPQALRELQMSNPYVRNVFIWQPQGGIIFPAKTTANEEEQRFLFRFAPVFNGDVSWTDSSDEVVSTTATSGWKPWFDGDRLYLLGWMQRSDGITGIELEASAILNHLYGKLFDYHRDGDDYSLELNDGQIPMFQWNIDPNNRYKLSAEIPLAPTLPHWTIKVYPWTQPFSWAYASIRIIGGLLIVLLATSLCAGGWLLVRDNLHQRKDALQKTSFVSNVSHELKTPLTNVRLYAELLSEGKADTPQKKQQYLDVIVTESERLTRLVNNVLDFGRLEQNRRQYNCEAIDLCQWLAHMLPSLQSMVDATGMTLSIKPPRPSGTPPLEGNLTLHSPPEEGCPKGGVVVLSDSDALSQVILNLIDNACKYAQSGKHIDISTTHNDHVAEIHIADRGPTIPSKYAQRIFERFFRIDDSLTATTGGSGLGLSIARQLMRGMNGDLRWKPRQGGGNDFIITLPLK